MSSGMVTEQQPAPGPNGSPPPPAGQGRSPVASRMDARAALKAALEKGEDAAPANDKALDGEGAVGAPPVSRTGSPDGSGSTPTPSAEEGEAGKSSAKPAEKPDPETEKRLAKVQDAEKRSREKLDAERKAHAAEVEKLAQQRKELDAQRAEFEAFQKLKERAKLDPAAALEALGVDDFDYAARQAYAKTKAKADDPANREAAARAMREREHADKLSATEKRLLDLERKLEEREQMATVQRQANEYMSGVMKAAEGNPLAKHVLAKDPDHANQRLRRIAYDLAQEMDDVPDAEDVIARFEQEERKALARYGVDPNTILSPSPANTKKNEQAAEKKNAAPTLSNDLTTPRVARTNVSEREKRSEVLAALESGKLD